MNNFRLPTLLLFALFIALCSARLGAQENELCFDCHNDPELTGATGDTLYVDSEKWTASIHNRMELECVSCHMDLAGFEDWPHPERLEKVDCSLCHDTAYELWQQGIHGLQAQAKGDLDAAGCAECHGSHDIMAVEEPSSRIYPTNLPHTCLNCHGDPGLADKHEGMGRAEVAGMYLESVHGKALPRQPQNPPPGGFLSPDPGNLRQLPCGDLRGLLTGRARSGICRRQPGRADLHRLPRRAQYPRLGRP